MKSRKRQMTEGIKLQNQGKIRKFLKKETYKYLGMLEADTLKQVEIKETNFKIFLRTRKLLETGLYCRKLIKGINTWAVRHTGLYLHQRTRTLKTMQKALHLGDNVDWLYVSRKGGERRLDSTEDSVDVLIWLKDYVEMHGAILIKVTRSNTYNRKTNSTKKLENKNHKKNNYIDIVSVKKPTSYTRKLGRRWVMLVWVVLREKLNLSS